MIHEFGEIPISQSVKAYKASMVVSVDIPGVRYILISTFSEVLSSIFQIFIFPLSFAEIIDSMREPVVVV